jgi:hypothetical protein
MKGTKSMLKENWLSIVLAVVAVILVGIAVIQPWSASDASGSVDTPISDHEDDHTMEQENDHSHDNAEEVHEDEHSQENAGHEESGHGHGVVGEGYLGLGVTSELDPHEVEHFSDRKSHY